MKKLLTIVVSVSLLALTSLSFAQSHTGMKKMTMKCPVCTKMHKMCPQCKKDGKECAMCKHMESCKACMKAGKVTAKCAKKMGMKKM